MIHVGHWPVQWSLVLNLNRLCFWGEKYWLVVLFIHLDWKQKCQLTVTVKFSLFLLFIQNNCVNFNQTSWGEWNLRFYKWEIVRFSKNIQWSVILFSFDQHGGIIIGIFRPFLLFVNVLQASRVVHGPLLIVYSNRNYKL